MQWRTVSILLALLYPAVIATSTRRSGGSPGSQRGRRSARGQRSPACAASTSRSPSTVYFYRQHSQMRPQQKSCRVGLLLDHIYTGEELAEACKSDLIQKNKRGSGGFAFTADSFAVSPHFEFDDGIAYRKQTGQSIKGKTGRHRSLLTYAAESYPLELSDPGSDDESDSGIDSVVFVLPGTTARQIITFIKENYPHVQNVKWLEIRSDSGSSRLDRYAVPFEELQTLKNARIFVEVG